MTQDMLRTLDADEVRRDVLRTLEGRREDGFTAGALAAVLALPVDAVRRALLDLAHVGLVLWDDDEFVSALPA